MTKAGVDHTSNKPEARRGRIIDLGTGESARSAPAGTSAYLAAGDQDGSIGQQRCGVVLAARSHPPDRSGCCRRRIIQPRGVCTESESPHVATSEQNLATREKSCGG